MMLRIRSVNLRHLGDQMIARDRVVKLTGIQAKIGARRFVGLKLLCSHYQAANLRLCEPVRASFGFPSQRTLWHRSDKSTFVGHQPIATPTYGPALAESRAAHAR